MKLSLLHHMCYIFLQDAFLHIKMLEDAALGIQNSVMKTAKGFINDKMSEWDICIW